MSRGYCVIYKNVVNDVVSIAYCLKQTLPCTQTIDMDKIERSNRKNRTKDSALLKDLKEFFDIEFYVRMYISRKGIIFRVEKSFGRESDKFRCFPKRIFGQCVDHIVS